MGNPPVRTLTLGIEQRHPLAFDTIQWADTLLRQASARYLEAGYEVQTVRLSTRPVFDDLADWTDARLLGYVLELQRMLDDVGLAFCSIGPAQAARASFPLQRIDVIADLLAATTAINATVQLATPEDGLRSEAALSCAQVMQRLSRETREGFGNFRFAALACVAPGSPFFPAAYHDGRASLSIGVQGAGVITGALQSYREGNGDTTDLTSITGCVRNALFETLAPVVKIGRELATEWQIGFGGIDLSPAPLGEDSIAAALEVLGDGLIGSPGTLALAAALTSAIKSTALPTCGYCGLMLPVLEDAVLGKRWEQGTVTTHQLLLYSAVCGTGLDTIPLPGDMEAREIARLLLDVAAL
ncbi:MAG TPA: DUF711 family protein, partial [Ktedonobacteraceae bacterium]|nr:DUF711 family protein [Ktedonobacteraceae bacterium]